MLSASWISFSHCIFLGLPCNLNTMKGKLILFVVLLENSIWRSAMHVDRCCNPQADTETTLLAERGELSTARSVDYQGLITVTGKRCCTEVLTCHLPIFLMIFWGSLVGEAWDGEAGDVGDEGPTHLPFSSKFHQSRLWIPTYCHQNRQRQKSK